MTNQTSSSDLVQRIHEVLRTVPDFPIAGVMFKDITPLLGDANLLPEVVDAMHAPFAGAGVTHVVGIESRGFMFGVPIALALGAAFVPVRKPGRLPYTTIRETFVLEYREDALEIHVDAFGSGARVAIVDDVLATGGTARATTRLVERLGGVVVGVSVLTQIEALGGRQQLAPTPVHCLLSV